jgi:hypothetical protein
MAQVELSSPKKNKWAERLRGRARMAVAAIGGVFLLGFLGVSRPLGQRIDSAKDRLAKAELRAKLASEIAELRHQSSLYQKKLTRGIDMNDWTQYLLAGIRPQRVKLVRMEPKEQITVGPCRVLTWQIEMEGDFPSISKVIAWMENGERLIRIDKLMFESHNSKLIVAMTLRGLTLVTPGDKNAAPRNNPAAPSIQIKTQPRGDKS